MKPRTTTSTGNTSHRCMIDTLGWGTDRRAFCTMCCVFSIHHALVRFRTCPCMCQEHDLSPALVFTAEQQHLADRCNLAENCCVKED